jgi:acyl dehydratase
MLYALGVGAGVGDLEFTTNNSRGIQQQALPTMAVTLGGDYSVLKQAGKIDWTRLVHAEQHVELLAPLPPEGEAVATTRIAEMWDKETAALVVIETEAARENGSALWRSRASLFVRGAGGWGGNRGPSTSIDTPDRPPTATVTYETRLDQALLYRLSGDYNPLHSDPDFARRAGFDQPILHGLCTYGFTGRAVLATAAGGDPSRLRSMSARFAASVYPGETLTVSIWAGGADGKTYFQTATQEGSEVIVNGVAKIAEE